MVQVSDDSVARRQMSLLHALLGRYNRPKAQVTAHGCGTKEQGAWSGDECAMQESVRQSRAARLVLNAGHGELIGARPWQSAFSAQRG